MFIRQSIERRPLGYVLPDKAVHVLVGATFPRVVWAGEIHVYSKFVGNLLVSGELLPVVGGCGVQQALDGFQHVHHRLGQRLRFFPVEQCQPAHPGRPVVYREQRPLVVFPDHGVEFQVTETDSLFHYRGTLLDADPVPDDAPTVFGRAALSVSPALATQVGVQVSATSFVFPYVLVDALVTDTLRAFQPAPTGHLFRAVVFLQQGLDTLAHGFGEADPLRLLPHPTLVFPLCEIGIVTSVAPVAVAPQLAADHGFVLAYRKCYQTIVATLLLHHENCVPLLLG